MIRKQQDETQTAFAIRQIQYEAWEAGWDARVAFEWEGSGETGLNPYADRAVKDRVMPSWRPLCICDGPPHQYAKGWCPADGPVQ